MRGSVDFISARACDGKPRQPNRATRDMRRILSPLAWMDVTSNEGGAWALELGSRSGQLRNISTLDRAWRVAGFCGNRRAKFARSAITHGGEGLSGRRSRTDHHRQL